METEEAATLQEDYRSILDGCKPFSLGYELFCAEIVSGNTAASSARTAGFVPRYADELLKKPEIQARIAQLLEERRRDSGVVSRVWVECQMVRIIKDAMEGIPGVPDQDGGDSPASKGVPPNRELAERALMNLSRLKGWIVERKQTVNARVSAGASASVELAAMLEDHLTNLPAAERAKIKRLAQGSGKIVDAE